jgi:hypothetical protein
MDRRAKVRLQRRREPPVKPAERLPQRAANPVGESGIRGGIFDVTGSAKREEAALPAPIRAMGVDRSGKSFGFRAGQERDARGAQLRALVHEHRF